MKKYAKTITTVCPSCQTQIHFNKKPRLGDPIICHECEETLKVARLTPLKLAWYFADEGESWADVDIEEYEDRYSSYDFYDEN